MGMSNRDYHIKKYAAIEQSDGSWLHDDGDVYWYNEVGYLHREDGPACIYFNGGGVEWWLNGNYYFVDDWLIELNKSDECKMMLRLQYG
tara:strand:- start:909 stop:1175 length:267 start_codon:yes stop_codon:yes gene_type:complete